MHVYAWFTSWLNSKRHEQGQGLVEYALIMMLITIVLISSLAALGSVLQVSYYDRLVSELFTG